MPPTLPLLLLFGVLAQAEPAPAEMTPSLLPAPVPEGTAPAAPTPNGPAPAGAHPGPDAPPPPETPIKVGFRAGADYQLSGDVAPRLGYSLSPFLEYEAIRVADFLGFGVRATFTFDRFQQLVSAQAYVDGEYKSYRTPRTLSFFDFSLLPTATLHLGPIHPWIGVGAGLSLAHFTTQESAYLPGDARTTRPILLGAFGIDVAIGSGIQVGMHGEYRRMLAKPDFSLNSGEKIKPFGDRLSVQAAILYLF